MFKKIIIYQNNDQLMINNFKGMLKDGNLENMFHVENRFGIRVDSKIKRIGKKKLYNKLVQAWTNCYNQYLETFGLNKAHLRLMDQEDKIALLKIRMHVEDKGHLSAIIKAEERRLEAMQIPDNGKGQKQSYEEDLVIIQKHQGVPIDGRNTTVNRFYTYIKFMEKESEEIRAQNVRENR